jgi:hypothetical protein
MFKGRSFVAAFLGCSLGLSSAGCSGDSDGDDGAGGGGGGQTPALGTCDLRSLSLSCIELHDASAIDLVNQEEGCVEHGGDWSNDACSSDDLVGCCEYTFGNEFRECFYTGIARDPVAYCADTVSGVWTPAN